MADNEYSASLTPVTAPRARDGRAGARWTRKRAEFSVSCVTCGVQFTPVTPQRRVTSIVFGIDRRRTCCGDECKSRLRSRTMTATRKAHAYGFGNLHHNYKDGRSYLSNGWRGPNWEAQADKARERDGHCRGADFGIVCKTATVQRADYEQRYGKMPVHHIVPFQNFKNYKPANKLSNLATLCLSCHMKVEGRRAASQLLLPLHPDRKQQHKPALRGERVATSKYTETQVLYAADLIRDGRSVEETSRLTGIPTISLSNMVNGRQWQHIFAGVVYKSQPARGATVGIAKLTDASVLEIRRLAKDGASNPTIARQFGVSINTIRAAVIRRTWTHLPPE